MGLTKKMEIVASMLAGAFLVTSAWAQGLVPQQLLHPQPGGGDNFGYAIAVSGDTMVVGADRDNEGVHSLRGSAHVYRWTGSTWTFEASLAPSTPASTGRFGFDVAISGNTIVVGSYFDPATGPFSTQGAAYVFTRSGTTWIEQAKLTPSDGAPNDNFGQVVAISSDTILVGAYGDDIGANANQGSAYVFARSGMAWTQQAKIVAADGASGDFFGRAVAISGDSVLIGAEQDDVFPIFNNGSAYVFVRSGSTWTQQARLNPADAAPQDFFGTAVDLSGDTAIIGATGDNIGALADQGSAYVFVRSGTTWTEQGKLAAPGGAANDGFGISVAVSADRVLVGTNRDAGGTQVNQGYAHIFVRSGGSWTHESRVVAPDGAADDLFGHSVALAGDTGVVGGYQDNVGPNTDQGSVWVFSRGGSTWTPVNQVITASDGAQFDLFGSALAVDGDTLIVGARNDDSQRGSAYVFTRAAGVWTQQAKLTASDGIAGDFFGFSVGISGDTAIVGAMLDDSQRGSAYIFTRSGSAWTQQAKLIASDGVAGDDFGYAVAISGDSALIGADRDNIGSNSGQGSAYVFVRSAGVWSQQAHLTALDGAPFDYFGRSVALSDDTAVVGTEFDDVGANDSQGSAYVFVRSGVTWTQQAHLTAPDGAASDRFGNAMAIRGDRVLIGAYNDSVGANTYQGSAYLFERAGTAWTQQAKLVGPNGSFDQFGYSVAFSDDSIVIGANYDTVGGNSSQGSAIVFSKFGSTWIPLVQLITSDGASGDQFGNAVAMAGDTALVATYFDAVGSNSAQGSVRTFNVARDAFSVAYNASANSAFSALASAVGGAASGDQIIATPLAWSGVGSFSTLGLTLLLDSTGNLRTPSAASITLGGSSSLSTPPGSVIDIFGQFLAAAGASPTISGDAFSLGASGLLGTMSGSTLTLITPSAFLEGMTTLASASSMNFAGTVQSTGPISLAGGSQLSAAIALVNADALSMNSGTIISPLFSNLGNADVFGLATVQGDLANASGASTTIRSATLVVVGSLNSSGAVVGTVCPNCLSSPPNLEVESDLVLTAEAELRMPFSGSLVHLGGSFDCAITSNTRFDMSPATLRLEANGGVQALEVMSTDIGADALGLDRTLAGHYPIGVLHIGPSPSTVHLVDSHDNDGQGQGSCEAIYVDLLAIDAGSRLINPSCRIYYNTLINNGSVDVPGNLVPITSPCITDVDDGSFTGTPDGGVTIDDLLFYRFIFEQGDIRSDVDDGSGAGTPDGGVTIDDLLYYLLRFEAGC